MGYIYKITNNVNGKIYVGKTTRTIEKRFKEHILRSKSQDTYLKRAIVKYGESNFTVEQLEKCDDSILDEREMFWIENLNSYDNHIGYNLTLGGDGAKKYSNEEAEMIISLWNNGLTARDIKAFTGISINVITRFLSTLSDYEETRKRRTHEKIYQSIHKKINKYDLEGNLVAEYDSIVEASRSVEGTPPVIINCMKTPRSVAYGFIWKYANDKSEITPQKYGREHPVVQYDLKGNVVARYNSIREAVKETKIPSTNIIASCQKRVQTAKGFCWRYEEDNSPIEIGRLRKKAVIQMDMDNNIVNTFDSALSASKETGFSFSSIQACCAGRNKSAHNFIFKYA